MWSGSLYLTPGAFLYVGPAATAEPHAHHAVQFVAAADEPVEVSFGSRQLTARAVLIASGVEHALRASGRIALLLVEAHGVRGKALSLLASNQVRDVTSLIDALPSPFAVSSVSEFLEWYDVASERLIAGVKPTALSAASRRAIEFVESNLEGMPRLVEAAAAQGMSPSRLTHVFSAEVGLPFRRFVLWTRIKRAADAAERGRDLTQAAVEAGFSDAAHFSRTFRGMFGINPSSLLSKAFVAGSTATPPAPPVSRR